MKTQHTPGPWEIEPHSTIDKCFNVGPGISIDYDDVNHEEQDANARLVSAAPELLEALQLIIGMAEDGYKLHIKNGSHQEFLSEDRDALIKANQVIKKAKGE